MPPNDAHSFLADCIFSFSCSFVLLEWDLPSLSRWCMFPLPLDVINWAKWAPTCCLTCVVNEVQYCGTTWFIDKNSEQSSTNKHTIKADPPSAHSVNMICVSFSTLSSKGISHRCHSACLCAPQCPVMMFNTCYDCLCAATLTWDNPETRP